MRQVISPFWANRFTNGLPYDIGPLSCLSCVSVCDIGVLWPNGWTDQDETWRAGRPRTWPHCVRLGQSSPFPKKETEACSPIFGPCLLWPNGWMKMPLGTEVHLGPGHIVLDGSQLPMNGAQQPLFSAHVYCGHGHPSQLLLSSCLFLLF